MGDIEAANRVHAWSLINSDNGESDYQRGIQELKALYKQGDEKSGFLIGKAFQYKKEYFEAFSVMKDVVEKTEYPPAQLVLALYYFKGLGTAKNQREFTRLMTASADNGHITAQVHHLKMIQGKPKSIFQQLPYYIRLIRLSLSAFLTASKDEYDDRIIY